MAVTIKDVADKAGVSPSTVSRVLSNNKAISEKTRIKVQKAMKELHYYPNLTARSLVSKESKVIGLVLPESSDAFYQNPFFPTTLRGINEIASDKGFSLLLNTGSNDQERLENIYRMVNGRLVDGLIFLYSQEKDPILDFVRQSKIPFVIIGQTNNWETHFVDNNNEEIAKEATTYLIKQGYKNLAFIGGEDQLIFLKARYAGFVKALKDHQLTLNPAWVFNGVGFLPETGYKFGLEIGRIPEIEAVVIADQLVARGFKDAILHHYPDRNIPYMTFKAFKSDIFHDKDCPYMNINAIDLGRRAFQILYDVLNTPEESQGRYIHEVVHAELVK